MPAIAIMEKYSAEATPVTRYLCPVDSIDRIVNIILGYGSRIEKLAKKTDIVVNVGAVQDDEKDGTDKNHFAPRRNQTHN